MKTYNNLPVFNEKLTLLEYYEKLTVDERNYFTSRVMGICQKSSMTVYRWVKGQCNPRSLEKQAIAQELGRTVEELFPVTVRPKESPSKIQGQPTI